MRSRLGVSLLLLAVSGCGGAPSTSESSNITQSTALVSKPVPTSFNPLGDLLTQAHAAVEALQDPSPDAQAVVRFLIFTRGPLAPDQATRETLKRDHFNIVNASLKTRSLPPLALSKLSNRFKVAHLTRSDELPLNLSVFEGVAQRRGVNLSELRGLTVVSYQGRALREGLQLRVTCEATAQLGLSKALESATRGQALWVASLATFELFSLPELAERCQSREERWVRPSVELIDPDPTPSLRLVSLGLNQWGRPELEHGPLSERQARAALPRFVEALEVIRVQPFPSSGDEQSSHPLPRLKAELSPCLRPDHHYETSCRRIVWR